MVTENDLTLRKIITEDILAEIATSKQYTTNLADVVQTDYLKKGECHPALWEYREKGLKYFRKWLRDNLERLKALSTIERSIEIYTFIQDLECKYPDVFTRQIGYFSKRRLVELFLEGKVTIEGIDVEAILEKERLLKEEVARKKQEEAEARARAAQMKLEKERLREETRVPLQKGMLFKSNGFLFTCFDNLPTLERRKTDCVKNHTDFFTKEYINSDKYSNKVWLITEVFSDIPRVYLDTVLNIKDFDYEINS